MGSSQSLEEGDHPSSNNPSHPSHRRRHSDIGLGGGTRTAASSSSSSSRRHGSISSRRRPSHDDISDARRHHQQQQRRRSLDAHIDVGAAAANSLTSRRNNSGNRHLRGLFGSSNNSTSSGATGSHRSIEEDSTTSDTNSHRSSRRPWRFRGSNASANGSRASHASSDFSVEENDSNDGDNSSNNDGQSRRRRNGHDRNSANENERGDVDEDDNIEIDMRDIGQPAESLSTANVISPPTAEVPYGQGSEPPSLVDFVDDNDNDNDNDNDAPSSEDFTVQTSHSSSPLRGGSRRMNRLAGLQQNQQRHNHHHHHHHDDDDNTTNNVLQRSSNIISDNPVTPPRQSRNIRVGMNSNYETTDGPSILSGPDSTLAFNRRTSVGSTETGSTVSYMDEEDEDAFGSGAVDPNNNKSSQEFFPQKSKDFEWMGRSIESLILGHTSRAPILQLIDEDDEAGGDPEDYYAFRRRSTASTFGGGGYGRRRSSAGSFAGGNRRGSLSLSTGPVGPGAAVVPPPATPGTGSGAYHGGTLANYYNSSGRRRGMAPTDVDRSYNYNERQGRRGSTTSTHTPVFRRRSSMAASGGPPAMDGESALQRTTGGLHKGGPNIALTLMARENTGRSFFPRGIAATQCLRSMGGHAMFSMLDKPAAGICTEVAFLEAAIDTGDWTETQTIISRLAPRIIGDPMSNAHNSPGGPGGHDRVSIDDPTLPPNAPKYYAGGGRTGLERDAFVQAGGVEVLIRVFREKSFVGQEMAYSYDARDLSPEIVAARLAPCWNEALAALRELVFSIPSLVETRKISDNGEFLPFLFTLLSHQSCFDGAAALIEEILALLSQSPTQQSPPVEVDTTDDSDEGPVFQPIGRVSPPTTFFLGNVPDLYKLWQGFNCRQLAHFCRILALLVFEPEDRQILESPAVLKSLELLQLRRNRAVRAGRDSTVDMNQAILLGDEVLVKRLLMLLRVMNFAPSLRHIAPYHVMAQFPFIADTLIMLGLSEIENWNEIERQEALARRLLEEENKNKGANEPDALLSELGGVAEMLEGLSETLGEASNQIGHIIHVISAAQQAGVIVGRGGSGSRGRRRRRGNRSNRSSSPASGTNQTAEGSQATPQQPSVEDQESAAAALRLGGIPVDNATIQGLASVAGILTDQVLVRRLYQNTDDMDGGGGGFAGGDVPGDDEVTHGSHQGSPRHFINTPEDSANSLQFNAILLGSYQVEVLFVLCTLLGGRRKLDAQDLLERLGLVPVLDDMFQRLPWYRKLAELDDGEENPDERGGPETQNGIHGPGCDCTPESALCVQYLRLLHNFCARDCDNYSGRRLLLSDSERNFVFHGPSCAHHKLKKGLLSKIIAAFIHESDESPYRFWLASCIESYLRGSSTEEQMFAAQSGLMQHLIDDVSSDRLHCAGSLQTSFDLLGELTKGSLDVIRLLVNDFDEESFRKLLSVAAANLVDSNVFIRSLLLSLERLSSADMFLPLYFDSNSVGMSHPIWMSETGSSSCSYLTHSWWDSKAISLVDQGSNGEEDPLDEDRQSDWFPTLDFLEINSGYAPEVTMLPSGLEESVGHFGWVFTPGGDSLSPGTYLPNTVERLNWFLSANQARLLRDLLGVVDLRNINHENICCLNTAVVIAIFAYRRRQLSLLLDELRQMNDEEKEAKRRTFDAAHHDDVVDRAFAQAMRYLDIENQRETPSYARIASIAATAIGDRTDAMRNFREVLWFWTEYYTHRGRDRLSLEFSSHLRFQEWNHVVSLLSADDGSSTALIRSPPRLPRSPYQRAARIAENPVRGV